MAKATSDGRYLLLSAKIVSSRRRSQAPENKIVRGLSLFKCHTVCEIKFTRRREQKYDCWDLIITIIIDLDPNNNY